MTTDQAMTVIAAILFLSLCVIPALASVVSILIMIKIYIGDLGIGESFDRGFRRGYEKHTKNK